VAARGLARHVPAALPEGDRLNVVGIDSLAHAGRGSSVRPRLGAQGALARLLYEQTTVADEARAADLVHLCDARPLLLSRVPFIITVHDVTFIDHPEWMPPKAARYKQAMLRAALLRRPQAILCDSHHTRQRLLECEPLARRMKVDVVHLGVDAPPPNALWRPVEPEPYFLTVSTIEPRKNHMTLLRAYAQLRRSGLSLRWKVAGSPGHLSGPILAALREQDGVDVLDYVTPVRRDQLLGGATFVALPSLEEGFGFPVLEAMARGVPTSCSTGSALDEVAGDAAVRVGPNDVAGWVDALTRLAEGEALRRELSARGHARAEQFSWAATARNVVDLYDELRGSVETPPLRSRQSPARRSVATAPLKTPVLRARGSTANLLFVDHATTVGEPQRFLLELLQRLPSTVAPTVMCPAGDLMDAIEAAEVPVISLPEAAAGGSALPRRLSAATAELAASGLVVRRAAGRIGADLVHANSVHAGLIAGAARRLGGPPTIVDVHGALPSTLPSSVVHRLLRVSGVAVIRAGGARSSALRAAAIMAKAQARSLVDVPPQAKLVGVIAEITPSKGQDTAVKAFELIRQREPDARLILVGRAPASSRSGYDNVSFERWLYRLVRSLDLESCVEFWGAREDHAMLLRALDVLMAPSWQEPFGGHVLDAMALETAVIATNVGGLADYVTHGVDGLLLPPRAEVAWAVALERVLRDGSLRSMMVAQAARTAHTRFPPDDAMSELFKLYDEIADRPRRFVHGA
jgi:glycosyltransferase involved in cell wall biosynthesis